MLPRPECRDRALPVTFDFPGSQEPGARRQESEDKKILEYIIFLFPIEIGIGIEIDFFILYYLDFDTDPDFDWDDPILTSFSCLLPPDFCLLTSDF